MILMALLSFLLQAAPVQDTLPQDFDWNLPLKAWEPSDSRFDQGSGHWSLVFFFSPTCGHCHHAWPYVEEWKKRYGSRGLTVEAVASGYATNQDLEFLKQDMTQGAPFVFPVFHDSTKALASRMKVKSVPVFFLVDPKGRYQRWVGSFPSTLREIESTIARQFRWRRNTL